MLTGYSVRLDIATDRPADEDGMQDLVCRLVDRAGVVSFLRDRYRVTISVDAADHCAALAIASRIVGEHASTLGISLSSVMSCEVITEEELDRQLAEPA
jgi:hypothetical protein